MLENGIGQIVLAVAIDDGGGGIGGFRRGVNDQRIAGGLGLGSHGGFDVFEDVFAHPLALIGKGDLRLPFILVNGRPGILQLFQFGGGSLFAFVAFVGGNGLVIRLLQKLLVFIAALLQIVAHVPVVLVELRFAVVERGLCLPGLPIANEQLAQVHGADLGLCPRGDAQSRQQQNGQKCRS